MLPKMEIPAERECDALAGLVGVSVLVMPLTPYAARFWAGLPRIARPDEGTVRA
jgi:hypothetical protein